jgi:N-acetyl-gamma-glutamyl-phosphate reductase
MTTVSIIGGSGYSGAELMRLLSRRSDIRLAQVTANSSAGQRVDMLYPDLAGRIDLAFEEYHPDRLQPVDLAFVALPSGQAMGIVPDLRARAGRVIDLGGDFRLKSPDQYLRYYKHTHSAVELLADAVYGLPELNAKSIAPAPLVANPGCYPTGAILALLPALTMGLIEPERIVINSLSGVSGAGRSAAVDMSFAEINENVRAYKLGVHQHIPEIESVLREATSRPVSVSFVPHLIPITRGIYTTIHANLAVTISEAEIIERYETFYGAAPFVRVKRDVPQIQAVVRTNYCDIGMKVEPRTNQLIVMSVIDNLVKGAAGQAVQNMNLMLGVPEDTGLR